MMFHNCCCVTECGKLFSTVSNCNKHVAAVCTKTCYLYCPFCNLGKERDVHKVAQHALSKSCWDRIKAGVGGPNVLPPTISSWEKMCQIPKCRNAYMKWDPATQKLFEPKYTKEDHDEAKKVVSAEKQQSKQDSAGAPKAKKTKVQVCDPRDVPSDKIPDISRFKF